MAALALTAAVLVPLTMLAGPDAKSAKKPAKKGEPVKIERVEITGSMIKQEAKRSGSVTTTCAPVLIIDRQAIERSGAGTLAELLRRHPATAGR